MGVAILGGLDRLKRSYEKTAVGLGFRPKMFGQKVPRFGKRLGGVEAIILFTGTISHDMVRQAIEVARQSKIKIIRVHNSGVGSLKRCLEGLAAV